MVNEFILQKWEKEYINDLDINKKEFISLNKEEMKNFINENYYDELNNRYVTGKSDIMLLGLQFIDTGCYLTKGDNIKYLICTTPNNKGTKTILSHIIYHENCLKIVKNQKVPVTLLEYSEANSYFRNQGLNKSVQKEFANLINYDQDLITTSQTIMGFKCHVFDSLKSILLENNFNQDIKMLSQVDKEYEEYLKGNKSLTLKKM